MNTLTLNSLTANNASTNNANLITTHSDSVPMNEQLALLGEKLGEFKAYDSQLVIPEIEGTRIIKCLYQTNKKTGEKLQENSYCRVATKHLTEEHILARVAELTPYVLSWLQEIESSMIREQHKKGGLSVFPASLSLDKLIEHLDTIGESSRLNKEKIGAWFISSVQDDLAVLFAAKMGLTEQSSEEEVARLELVLGAYKVKFESLASGKVFIKEDDCKAMLAVITGIELARDSLIGVRFSARLNKMMTKEDETLLSL